MAYKNHNLDDLIVTAAKDEFLEFGYEKASLRKIAKKAGITTGAFYTRYKSKDDIFEHLIKDNINFDIDLSLSEKLYEEASIEKSVDKFLLAVKEEQKIYLEFMFKNFDECKLLICKSKGSIISKKVKVLIDEHVEKEYKYFNDLANKKVDVDGIMLIVNAQTTYFKKILERGYTKDKACSVLETVQKFLDSGWTRVFEEMI